MKAEGFTKFLYKVEKISSYIPMALLGIMSIVVWLEVFFRYVLRSPISWAPETARYIFIWIVFLGAFLAFRRGSHLKMDILVRFLPERVTARLNLITDVLTVIYTSLVLWSGRELIAKSIYQSMPLLGIPIGIVHLIVPVSAILVGLDIVVKIFSNVRINMSKK